jgi:hypothetical protein
MEKALLEKAHEGELPCALAFKVADGLDIPPEAVGACADRLGIRLVRCQLGLFGYAPEKKIVRPLSELDADLSSAIREGLEGGRLPCRAAWRIADERGLDRMTVSAACERLEIKIKPCQLGAF